jgi:chromosome segregation ATPase
MSIGHDFDAELRRAKVAALEAEVRAQNCERALEHMQDEVASLRAVALSTPDASWQDDRIVDLEQQLEAERDRRIEAERELAGCVPLADVQKLLATCEERYAGGATASDVLDELVWFVVARNAAARGEGGEP